MSLAVAPPAPAWAGGPMGDGDGNETWQGRRGLLLPRSWPIEGKPSGLGIRQQGVQTLRVIRSGCHMVPRRTERKWEPISP